ncbi:DUF397 domain-containing protein [Streptomyces sp. NPDC015127]|uniref:DUF397 domain-containing protein n=1 Tax=Streptomyces sp. NPDC015127 TaxID=3364939 RepID=UPI0037019595
MSPSSAGTPTYAAASAPVRPPAAKSSYSSGEGECVEVAVTPATVHVRDSKDTTRPSLTLSLATWTTFLPYAHRAAVPDTV